MRRVALGGLFAAFVVAASAACEGRSPSAPEMPTGAPAADAGIATSDASRGAEAQLALLKAMPADMLDHLSKGGRPDAIGAVGQNRPTWMGAQYQRGAMLYFLWAVSQNDRDMAEDAWRAVDLTFSHQDSNGAFGARNESGAPAALKDVYSDAAFWLAHLDQAILVVHASALADAFRDRVAAILPKLRLSASLLAQGKDALEGRDAVATNRYFIDALAYELSGVLLNDDELVSTGAQFVALAFAKQSPDGYFEEASGWDSSYNCVSIWMLQIHDLYFPDPKNAAGLARSIKWELGRVRSTGEIDTTGNTRTGLDQERYFGQAKRVNYSEAVLALLYYGTRQNDASVLDATKRVYAYSLTAP